MKPTEEKKAVAAEGTKEAEEAKKAAEEAKKAKEKYLAEMARVRSRWFSLVLYPDNWYHCELLKYWEMSTDVNLAYIRHEPDTVREGEPVEGELIKKDHWHVLIQMPTAYTVGGMVNACGKAWAVPTEEEDDTSEEEDKEAEKDKKPRKRLRMLTPGESVPDYAKRVDILPRRFTQACSSPAAVYKYLTHEDFKSVIGGKKKYDRSAIIHVGDLQLFKKLRGTDRVNSMDTLMSLKRYAKKVKSRSELIEALLLDGREDLITYVAGHAYFISTFFFKGGED